jgi:hypothetical protein
LLVSTTTLFVNGLALGDDLATIGSFHAIAITAAPKAPQRAKGILQRDLTISEPEAYLMLQRQSQQRRKPMKEIAEAIVLSSAIKEGS